MSMLLYKRIRPNRYRRDPSMSMREVAILAACFVLFCVFVKVGAEYFDGSQYTVGLNGMVETRCIGGMQFTVDNRGHATQVLSEFGKGIPCR